MLGQAVRLRVTIVAELRRTGIAANQYDTKFPDDYYIPASNYFELHRCKLSILVKR